MLFWPRGRRRRDDNGTAQTGDAGGDLVRHGAPGRVSIITGLTQSCVRTQSMFYRGGLLTDGGGGQLPNGCSGI